MLYSQLHNQFTYYPQMLLLNHFEWQLHHRDTLSGGIAMSINMSLLTGAASFIEAATKNFLLGHIQQIKDKNANSPDALTLFDALLATTHEQLLGSTWHDLVNTYTLIVGRKPTQSSPEHEAIQKLFTFRNELVHGQQIHATIAEDKVSYQHKYQGVVEYLIKVKVLDQQLLLDSNGSALLSDIVADYFLGKALAFAFNLLNNAGDAGLPWRNQLGTSIFSMFYMPHLRRLMKENGVNIIIDHTDLAGNPLPDMTNPDLPTY
jgi:hypothetical protein